MRPMRRRVFRARPDGPLVKKFVTAKAAVNEVVTKARRSNLRGQIPVMPAGKRSRDAAHPRQRMASRCATFWGAAPSAQAPINQAIIEPIATQMPSKHAPAVMAVTSTGGCVGALSIIATGSNPHFGSAFWHASRPAGKGDPLRALLPYPQDV